MGNKERFEELLKRAADRPGFDGLLNYIRKSDFYTAPASTKFHLSCEGGLLQHSLNVYDALVGRLQPGEDDTFRYLVHGKEVVAFKRETLVIVALLHDLCKANFYKKGTRNVKNDETGKWEKVPSYSVEDMFPYGHGEKSVFLIERFMKLKVEEAVAIRWHMGGFDDAVRGGSFAMSGAFEKYPLAVKLHISDLEATYLMETREA